MNAVTLIWNRDIYCMRSTNSNASTTATGLTKASRTPAPCIHYPPRSLSQTR